MRIRGGWPRALLIMAAVCLPAVPAGLCGCVVAVDLARHRGVDLAAAAWLGMPTWIAGLVVLVAAVLLCRMPRLRRPGDQLLLAVGIASLTATGFLCCLTSVLAVAL